jgi:hypothetical protein
MYGLGAWLNASYPSLHTSGMQLLIWGFLVSTVALYHTTYAINSLAHTHGTRRFPTKDESRNNLWLALLTFGEGWHNNHHYYPSAARQGFYWWEVDVTYYLLRCCASLGLVWDLREVPQQVLAEGRALDAGQPVTGRPSASSPLASARGGGRGPARRAQESHAASDRRGVARGATQSGESEEASPDLPLPREGHA